MLLYTAVIIAVGFAAALFVSPLLPAPNKPPLEQKFEDLGLMPIVTVNGKKGELDGRRSDGHSRQLLVEVTSEGRDMDAWRFVFNACRDGKWKIEDGRIAVMKYTGRHGKTPEHAYFVKCSE
jgi:hypothetical protein